ncbi:MAG: hypothetical protein Gaeavirus7_5 [Gaeavirus sp.]|uniref:Uncharacterized protein n=1 Tax=Gaeavirus sp. TaxID=2487767 RepID=A0A3G4ZYR2_9VIRU|nr:MAG: hypothetical protein Gaeavirus7_5 [Gaeavirus sp.]
MEYAKLKNIELFNCHFSTKKTIRLEDSMIIFVINEDTIIPPGIKHLYTTVVRSTSLDDLPLSLETLTIHNWNYFVDAPLTNLPPSLKKLTLSGTSRDIDLSSIRLPYDCELVITKNILEWHKTIP